MIVAGLVLLSAAPAYAGTAYEEQRCQGVPCYGPYAVYADVARTGSGTDVPLNARNDVTVSAAPDGSSVTLLDSRQIVMADPTTGCAQSGIHAATCTADPALASAGPPYSIFEVDVQLGGGDDRYTSTAASPVGIGVTDGSGNDVLTGGPGPDYFTLLDGNDTATTGDGADSVELFGRSGNDIASTGAGDDHVSVSTTGTGWVSTGDGADQVSVSESGGVAIDLGAGDDQAFVWSTGPVTIACGPGDDHVFVDGAADPTLAPDCETVTRNP